MTQALDPRRMPLRGSRLIEASAGTGKTWTIAALYLRLILGHGQGDQAPAQALLPHQILVMTFTRAATRELQARIRRRLEEAARAFRHPQSASAGDDFLAALLADYPDQNAREGAAWQLDQAAASMDDSAVFTIDGWCQRSLREHAFATGSDFRETLVEDEHDLLQEAIRDFWRQEVYPLDNETAHTLFSLWALDNGTISDPSALQVGLAPLLAADLTLESDSPNLVTWLPIALQSLRAQEQELRERWAPQHGDLVTWLQTTLEDPSHPLNRKQYNWPKGEAHLAELQDWVTNGTLLREKARQNLRKYTPSALTGACNKGRTIAPPNSSAILAAIMEALEKHSAARQNLGQRLLLYAVNRVSARLQDLKEQRHQASFRDYQSRLATLLDHPDDGPLLASTLRHQYPAALIDEFQDASAEQYHIVERIYAPQRNDPRYLLLLIGDPKQSIYQFRGADMHSYRTARDAMGDRLEVLNTNYRSSTDLIAALNGLYQRTEAQAPGRAFAWPSQKSQSTPLPYREVIAHGQDWQWQIQGQAGVPLQIWALSEPCSKATYMERSAGEAAERIVALLNDPDTGFARAGQPFRRLRPQDIAILVRDRHEGAVMRRALQERQVPYVYLAERESVYTSPEASDLLCWLEAVAAPEEASRLRRAMALPLLDLSYTEMDRLNTDEILWESRVGEFRSLHRIWRRHGLLAMLHQSIHRFALAARLLSLPDGERRLSNLLQLGELLQQASRQREGLEVQIRVLSEAIAAGKDDSDAHILRLESDAERLKIATIHSAKGLQYPLVYLPFIANRRPFSAPPSGIRVHRNASGHTLLHWDDAIDGELALSAHQEDLRLLYVALTRAEHGIWLGLAEPSSQRSPIFTDSAIAHLLGAGPTETPLPALLSELAAQFPDHLVIEFLGTGVDTTPLTPRSVPEKADLPLYTGQFDRDWGVTSFSQLTQALPPSPAGAPRRQDASREPWHAFPAGPLAGTFLHERLQTLAQDGFAQALEPNLATNLENVCADAGLSPWRDATAAWLREIVRTPLLAGEPSLQQLDGQALQTEMGFWLPVPRCSSGDLDALCQRWSLSGRARPALRQRQLHGMLHGFMDLVWSWGDRYYVLDYKSNRLGNDDSAYHRAALEEATLAHRYELQAALYQLALHRLLRQRLGSAYDPASHLGGTLLYYVRGLQGPERGILHLPAEPDLLHALDGALPLQPAGTFS